MFGVVTCHCTGTDSAVLGAPAVSGWWRRERKRRRAAFLALGDLGGLGCRRTPGAWGPGGGLARRERCAWAG